MDRLDRLAFGVAALLTISMATLMSVALLVLGLAEKGVCVG